MWEWFFSNKEWLFSGILVAIPALILSLIKISKKKVDSKEAKIILPREENIAFYPDPRLKIERPESHIRTEFYILFNVSMLNKDSIHNVKVAFNYYSSKKTPCIATIYETFDNGKDFLVTKKNETIYASGEGLVDWSVWILKKNSIDSIDILYGSMVYHGFDESIIGGASLLLVKVNKKYWEKYESKYYDQAEFNKIMPLVSELINKRQSKIISNFYDLANYNFFDIYEEVKVQHNK